MLGSQALAFSLTVSARQRSHPGASDYEITKKIKRERLAVHVVFALVVTAFMVSQFHWATQRFNCVTNNLPTSCHNLRHKAKGLTSMFVYLLLIVSLVVSVALMYWVMDRK